MHVMPAAREPDLIHEVRGEHGEAIAYEHAHEKGLATPIKRRAADAENNGFRAPRNKNGHGRVHRVPHWHDHSDLVQGPPRKAIAQKADRAKNEHARAEEHVAFGFVFGHFFDGFDQSVIHARRIARKGKIVKIVRAVRIAQKQRQHHCAADPHDQRGEHGHQQPPFLLLDHLSQLGDVNQWHHKHRFALAAQRGKQGDGRARTPPNNPPGEKTNPQSPPR